MSNWVEHVVWWQVYPLGFVGAEPELAGAHPEPHRLQRLTGWLDHLVSLGCNGLALGPIFTSSTHGYDTVDYFSIDPRLGDDGDFDALVAACRERGIRILLDGVFNHAGRDFPPVAQAFAQGPGSEAAQWVTLYDNGPAGLSANYFEGHDQLVELNHDAPAVQQHVRDVMLHWLGRGADGWRLDAAYAVPASFWAAVLPAVREQYPDAWFVGEMIHGEYAAYVAESGLDSVTAYELWKAVWSSLKEVNLHELQWTLGRHNDLVDAFVPMTFLSNHDVTRVASTINDPRHLPHAIALLGFVPGVPSVYYGDEFGLRAVKEDRAGGDDAVRPEMPDERGLFGEGDSAVEAVYRQVIGIRRRHPWLTDARISTSGVANEHMLITARSRTDETIALGLLLNLADEPAPLPPGSTVVDSLTPVSGGQLPGHSWAVLSGV
ncbi:MAG: glycosyl hydrolase, family 13 [Friedmanniella sp.]|nr:glycosyl hydrolase, family 13 [Friedmanniella sp.]